MLENITRREKLKATDPSATDASKHTLPSLVVIVFLEEIS